MAKSLQLRFRSHPLPDDWNGDVWEFQDALTERLVAESGDQIGLFVTGSTAPTSNMGPWLKDGEGWYFWDDTTGTYIPDEAVTALAYQVASNSAQISIILTTYADKDYAEAKMEEAITASTNYTNASITSLSGVYATQAFAEAKKTEAITASNGYTDAEILEESIVRAQDDGYLSGMYVLKVEAGSRVAGMWITAIDDPSGWSSTSEVAFRADVFKVYNGTSNIAPFTVSGGQVKVSGDLVIGYSDISGTKPPSNADVTLSAVNGGLNVTGGGIILDGGGAIRGGMTSFGVGKGFFLGYDGGEYKFMVGDPSGAYIKWDGSNWTENGWPTSGGGPTATVTQTSPINITSTTETNIVFINVNTGIRPVSISGNLKFTNFGDNVTLTVRVRSDTTEVYSHALPLSGEATESFNFQFQATSATPYISLSVSAVLDGGGIVIDYTASDGIMILV